VHTGLPNETFASPQPDATVFQEFGMSASMYAPRPAVTLRRYLRHGTLPQLAAFDQAMRLGSLTLAAETLHMAPPTMSGHMRKLSEALGVTLFEPRGRHMVPTPAAEALHAAAAEVFAAFERVDAALRPLRDAEPQACANAVSAAVGRIAAIEQAA
jgi:DNA-binding transcriptional ArsR family regulator